jgi:hypothetical protein
MMKMRMSTPHYLKQMKNYASPFGFVMHPRTRDDLKLTLLTPFNKDRGGWGQSSCINTRDGSAHALHQLAQGVVLLGDVLCGYVQHPEVKSLGPDGGKCKPHTRGLLRRRVIEAGLKHCIGKEVSRFEQGQNDFIENIDDACINYEGGRAVANENLVSEIRAVGLRQTVKYTGLDRKTIRATVNGQPVKMSTLAKIVIGLRAHQAEAKAAHSARRS